MKAAVSYSEVREKGVTQIKVEASDFPRGTTIKEVRSWLDEVRGPVVTSTGGPTEPVDLAPPDLPARVAPPTTITMPGVSVPTVFGPAVAPEKLPYFDLGDAEGKVGDKVLVPVYAGCTRDMTGFHIGGGCGGYRKLQALDVELGPMLRDYLMAQGVLGEMFSEFQFADWDHAGALPEEWWNFSLGFFSITDPKNIPGIPIPSGTLLFSVEFEILPQEPGTLELTCRDEWYYTQKRRRRKNFTYNGLPGGSFRIDTNGGTITVLEG